MREGKAKFIVSFGSATLLEGVADSLLLLMPHHIVINKLQ